MTDVEVTSVASEKNANAEEEEGQEEAEDTSQGDGYWSSEGELLEENVTETSYMAEDKYFHEPFVSVGLAIHQHVHKPSGGDVDIDKVFHKEGLQHASTATRNHSRLLKDRDARLW